MISECYFCGEAANSDDHLPSSCIFPDPKPENRIKVPSCAAHNVKQSMEDEYFRWFITTASSQSPIARNLIEGKVKRQFQRKPKLLHHLMEHSRKVQVYSTTGIYLGSSPAFEYDRARVQSVVTRLTKGFYYYFFKEKLPVTCRINDFVLNPNLDDQLRNAIVNLPVHEIGKNIFSFRFIRDEIDKNLSSWFFMFYDKTLIWSFTNSE